MAEMRSSIEDNDALNLLKENFGTGVLSTADLTHPPTCALFLSYGAS
jgi:hypothetical protein